MQGIDLTRSKWTKPEKWVWEQVCAGKVADFNVLYGAKLVPETELDPKTKEGWSSERELSPAFLKDILLDDSFRKNVPSSGVHIIGAWLTDSLNLENAKLIHRLELSRSRIESDIQLSGLKSDTDILFDKSFFNARVDLSFAKTKGYVSLIGVKCLGTLNMKSMEVGRHLFMSGSAEFTEVVLTDAKIDRQLDMTQAKCSGKLNMDSLEVGQHLVMNDSVECTDVTLNSARIGGHLDMTGVKCAGNLDMQVLEVRLHLAMRDGAEFSEVTLNSAKIGGQLDMNGVKCSGPLNMSSLEVGQHLFMRDGAEFTEVTLSGAKIGGHLSMTGVKCAGTLDMISLKIGGQLDMTQAKCSDKLNMNTLEVGQSLFMSNGEFTEVELIGAKIGGQLSLTQAKCSGKLEMERLIIKSDLIMKYSVFCQKVSIVLAKIDGNLYLSGAKLNSVDLSGTSITGDLVLGTPSENKPDWQSGSKLSLRNVHVGAVQDGTDKDKAWPDSLDLDGFVYSRLGGAISGEPGSIALREVEWFKNKWLPIGIGPKKFKRQPYHQLAKVLREMGDSEKSNDILYACKEQERGNAKSYRWVGLTFLKLSIGYGYGYRYFFSLFWVLLFTILGFCVIQATENAGKYSLGKQIFISLDLLLPFIELDKSFENIPLCNWQQYYFYFHKLMGFILGSFVLAGLSGITKK